MFLPGVDLLYSDDIDKISYSLIFFLAGVMSIGAVAAEIGIAEKVPSYATLWLSTGEAFIHIVVAFFLGILCVFFLSQITGLAALSIPLTKIAINAGFDPSVILYPFFYGSDLYFMPYQYSLLLLLMSFKRVHVKYLMRVLFIKALLSILIVLPAMILYWRFIGLW